MITLNQNSEVVAMKASGMSAHQVLAPLFLAAMLVAGISFAFNERIVTRSTAALSAWQKVEYKKVPKDSGIRTNIWVRDGDDLINATTVDTSGPTIVLGYVTLYARTGGVLSSMLSDGRSEEHTSEIQPLMRIQYADFCLKKKKSSER